MRWLLILMFAASLAGGWNWWTRERAVSQPPGVLVRAEPRQVDLVEPRRFAHKGYELNARARYEITARVLRKEIYRLDGGAGLAPVGRVSCAMVRGTRPDTLACARPIPPVPKRRDHRGVHAH